MKFNHLGHKVAIKRKKEEQKKLLPSTFTRKKRKTKEECMAEMVQEWHDLDRDVAAQFEADDATNLDSDAQVLV